jgi:hypothetical protein
MKRIKTKYYRASRWGEGSFWEIGLECNPDDKLYLSVGVVRCDEAGNVIDQMPLTSFGGLNWETTGLSGMKKKRAGLQQHVMGYIGELNWDYDREAFASKYRWNDELYKRDALQASDPDWPAKEPFWSEWFATEPWKIEPELEFEDWLERIRGKG